MKRIAVYGLLVLSAVLLGGLSPHRYGAAPFRVIAFFTGVNDKAHVSFVNEANGWFAAQARGKHFIYDTTSDWNNMTDSFLNLYDVVLFLDTRPDKPAHRKAFERYMKAGGGWMGFHFAAFALSPSDYPQDWNWYHQEFLGSGSYRSNTWRPTPAVLKLEDSSVFNLPALDTFTAGANEWYSWQNDLRKNDSIRIVLSIDPVSFPLGTGPKQHEIWKDGYYPVAWSNLFYNMIYYNLGHNDIDYEGGTNKTLSSTFGHASQDTVIVTTLLKIAERSARDRQKPL